MTAIVLAGGRGRRMRADKARLAVGDRTLLEHVLSQLEPYFEDILISVSRGQSAKAMAGSASSRVVEDEVPGLGPLGGILSGLRAAGNDACAVVACDIPDVDAALLRSLARSARDVEIAVPVGPAGHFEPLFAVYRKSVVPKIEILLRSGERSIIPLFGRCRTAVLRLGDISWLRNLNTREDYRSYLRSVTDRRTGGVKEEPRVPSRIRMKDPALPKKRKRPGGRAA